MTPPAVFPPHDEEAESTGLRTIAFTDSAASLLPSGPLTADTDKLTGADEDAKPWKVVGLVEGNSIFIDFTPKGGPANLEAKYVVGRGLVFPDGNVWTK